MNRIVLAHSGGVGTLVAIPWLAEQYRAEVVTVTLDLGQGRQLDDVHERALAAGAARAHVIEVREEFARDFILPALRADALYGGRTPLIRALGRAAIARRLKAMADIERASYVAHGDTDEVEPSFEALLSSLGSTASVIALARLWKFTAAELIEFGRQHGLPLQAQRERSYLVDANLWGRALEPAGLNGSAPEPAQNVYQITKSAADAPDVAAYVDIEFQRGVPVAVSGVEMSLVELIQSLETIAGAHGVGRVGADRDPSDVASRLVCEAPAAIALHMAHAELRRQKLTRAAEQQMREVAGRYAELAVRGLWFTQERSALDVAINKVELQVSGVVRLKLHKARCEVVAPQSPIEALTDGAPSR